MEAANFRQNKAYFVRNSLSAITFLSLHFTVGPCNDLPSSWHYGISYTSISATPVVPPTPVTRTL